MSRDFIARNPLTGKPIRTSHKRKKSKIKIKRADGPWNALLPHEILPLANGVVVDIEVNWNSRKHVLTMADGIRALPRLVGKKITEVNHCLINALGHLDSKIRVAGLQSLAICAQQNSTQIFEYLAELIDDVDLEVRIAASKCLGDVAAIFPSATETILRKELRQTQPNRKSEAWRGLRELGSRWPEVAAIHIEELLLDEDIKLRIDASHMIRRITKKADSKVWDLISWSLQDEDVQVRRNGAYTLRLLADSQPKIALILAEKSLFDEDEKVRESVIKSLNRMDVSTSRFKQLAIEGGRSRDANVRKACIGLYYRIMSPEESRDLATELLRQETNKDVRILLEELIWDAQIDGSESQKNTFLKAAPAVPAIDREIVESTGNKVSSMLEENPLGFDMAKKEDPSESRKAKRAKRISEDHMDDLEFDTGVEGDIEFGLDLHNEDH